MNYGTKIVILICSLLLLIASYIFTDILTATFLLLSFILGFIISKIFQNKQIRYALSKASSIGILLTDKNRKIIFTNKKFETIFKLKSKEICSMNFEKLCKEKLKCLSNSIDITKSSNNKVQSFEIEYSGHFYRVEVSAVLIQGIKYDGFVLMLCDIDTEKKLQKKQDEARHLIMQNAKTATIGELVGTISHQQKQPIATLSLLLDELEEYIQNTQTPPKKSRNEINEILSIAKNSILLMSQSIDSFVKFYHKDDAFKVVNITSIISELGKITHPWLCTHGIKMDLQIPNNEVFTYANSNYIKQILLALITNAKDELTNIKKDEKIIKIKGLS